MQQDRPVNGSSRELLYTGGENSTAEFTGAVRLWQGDKAETVVQGDKITVESKTGNLTAQGSVLSTMIVQDIESDNEACASRRDRRVRDSRWSMKTLRGELPTPPRHAWSDRTGI